MTDSESSPTWSPPPGSPVREGSPSCICSVCAATTPISTSRECLACQLSFCSVCAYAHTQHRSFGHHKLIPLSPDRICSTHLQENLLYCFECQLTCCVSCGEVSSKHKGHRIWDIDSAEQTVRNECEELTQKLTEMSGQLTVKYAGYEEQKRNIVDARETLAQSMRRKVGKLIRILNLALEDLVYSLDFIQQSATVEIDKDLEEVARQLGEISRLMKAREKAQVVGMVYPRAREMVEGGWEEGREMGEERAGEETGKGEIVTKEMESEVGEFVNSVEFITDIQVYRGGVTLENRWECRKCHNKNFPKFPTCKRCNTTNHLLESLLAVTAPSLRL